MVISFLKFYKGRGITCFCITFFTPSNLPFAIINLIINRNIKKLKKTNNQKKQYICHMNEFFSTAIGSYVKVFLTTVVAVYMAELSSGHDMFTFDIPMAKKLISAGVVSVLPIIHNALNPSDTRYGKKKGVEDFKPEKTDRIRE
jgi:hypothetical protein